MRPWPRECAKPTSSTREIQHDLARCRSPPRAAAGVRRHDLEQAVLLLDVPEWLKGDETQIAAADAAQARPQLGMASPQQRRHHLDAGQVGIPLVRRVGPRVPHVPLALIDAEFAKEQLVLLTREWYMHPNGQMPAYEWAFGDVNPPVHAWADVAGVPDRSQTARRRRRPGVSGARVPQAAAELHLVGQPQGRARTATSSRAASSASTTSASSTAARRCRPAATSIRPTAPAGWRCTPQPHAHRARARPAQPRVRGHRHEVLRALPAHRGSDEQLRRTTASACGTTRTSSSTTCCTCPTAALYRSRSARWSA